MLKVVIADDEERICQLIVKLIDWISLDMEIVAVATNGFETMEAVKKYHPEIVITDIRMPGMDGIELIKKTNEAGIETEFVIISGYRHFEYAQNAIRYGVSDYLLKPIKKTELNQTLERIRDRYHEKNEQITYEEQVKLLLKNDAGRLRTSYFSEILYAHNREVENLDIPIVNDRYHYCFGPGIFQIFCIKFDKIATNTENLNFIADKTADLTEKFIKDCCIEYEIYVEGSFIYLLLNYREDSQKYITRQMKSMLNEFAVLESILEGMKVTIGMGDAVRSINQLPVSLKTARIRTEQRIMRGLGEVISEAVGGTSRLVDSEIFVRFNRDMERALESFETEQVERVLDELRDAIKSMGTGGVTGHEILQLTKEACNLFLLSMQKQKIGLDNKPHILEDYSAKAVDSISLDELFLLLKSELLTAYNKAVQNKRGEYERPIRSARKYIQEHYMEPLTLETVSEVAGYNPAYFSTLFKKETGTSFLEYISGIRMEKAKQLLCDTNENIETICREVGYSDVKYFTKGFARYTGLKPAEYRKIYS